MARWKEVTGSWGYSDKHQVFTNVKLSLLCQTHLYRFLLLQVQTSSQHNSLDSSFGGSLTVCNRDLAVRQKFSRRNKQAIDASVRWCPPVEIRMLENCIVINLDSGKQEIT